MIIESSFKKFRNYFLEISHPSIHEYGPSFHHKKVARTKIDVRLEFFNLIEVNLFISRSHPTVDYRFESK